jgi:hypothetical protein
MHGCGSGSIERCSKCFDGCDSVIDGLRRVRQAGRRGAEFHALVNDAVHITPDVFLRQFPRQGGVTGADRFHNPGMVFCGIILVAGRLQPEQWADFGLEVNFLAGEPD